MKRTPIVLAFVLAMLAVTTMGWAAGMPVQFLMSSFFDDEAAPLAGGLVYSYSAGTTTPLALYEDAALTTPISQPLQLDAYGRALAFGSGNYKFVIKNSDGVTIATYDGLEYISTVAPTSLVVTNLTVASATFNEIYGKGGTLASMTFSGGLVSNSNLGNCKILAQPTVASDPVDFGYYSTDAASRTAYSLASLASHTSAFINPHGTDTYQTNLIASSVVGPLCASTTASNTGYLAVTASSVVYVGDQNCAILRLSTPAIASQGMIFYSAAGDLGAGEMNGNGIGYSPAFNEVNFGGATLHGYILGNVSSFTYDEAAGPTQIPPYGGGYITIGSYVPTHADPATYTLVWGANIYNGSASNAATVLFELQKNGTTIQSRKASVTNDGNFNADVEWTCLDVGVVGGDIISIRASCYGSISVGSTCTYVNHYYISGVSR